MAWVPGISASSEGIGRGYIWWSGREGTMYNPSAGERRDTGGPTFAQNIQRVGGSSGPPLGMHGDKRGWE